VKPDAFRHRHHVRTDGRSNVAWNATIRRRKKAEEAELARTQLSRDATAYLGGVTPYHYADFITNRMLYAGADVGNVTQATGYSFTRASQGYYTNSDGTLTLFGSGALRRGDRGVLIEGARTNLLVRSQEFGTTWTAQRTTITENTIAAPDGTTTADTVLETVENGNHGLFQGITKAASSITYALSCHIKPNGRNWAILQLNGPGETNRIRVWFDLTGSGTVGSNVVEGAGFSFVSASIQGLANGWYRCVAVITTDTSTALTTFVRTATGDTLVTYAGDITKGLYLWGAQLEAASFPSSYIPTVAAAATRAGSNYLSATTSGLDSAVSMWAEVNFSVSAGAFQTIVQFDDGTADNRIVLRRTDSGFANAVVVTGGVTQASIVGGAMANNVTHKIAMSAMLDSVRLALNGTSATPDTSATMPTGLVNIRVGAGVSIALPSFANHPRFAMFNSALSAANLETATA
jgi:hypothetical protein